MSIEGVRPFEEGVTVLLDVIMVSHYVLRLRVQISMSHFSLKCWISLRRGKTM